MCQILMLHSKDSTDIIQECSFQQQSIHFPDKAQTFVLHMK